MELIRPDWPAPSNVHAFTTTRNGGCSQAPWNGMNLGRNCGDDATAVQSNHDELLHHLPAIPQWLKQVHGTRVVAHPGNATGPLEGDALVTDSASRVCAVLTADCLPVLYCTRSGSRVAAAHAGWRGLAAGILEATVMAMRTEPEQILAWLGPAIGPTAYEVGDDVRKAFSDLPPDCFTATGDRWLFDLYLAARCKLIRAGVVDIFGGGFCTYNEQNRFFSFRRDGVCGRMASLIWLDSPGESGDLHLE